MLGRTLPLTPSRALELLRIGLGIVWSANLIFIIDPANEYFPTFQATAESYAPTTATGPWLAGIVAGYPLPFAYGIAITTFYLAFAFLTGSSVRLACFVGALFTSILLLTQWGSTMVVPGGTDVGPQPLYILLCGVLYLGGVGRDLTLRGWLVTEDSSGIPHVASRPGASSPPLRVGAAGRRTDGSIDVPP